jgi:hypothetical protein
MVAEIENSPAEGNPEINDHPPYPKEGHLFEDWQSLEGLPKAKEYRRCMHPKCHYYETREAPKG